MSGPTSALIFARICSLIVCTGGFFLFVIVGAYSPNSVCKKSTPFWRRVAASSSGTSCVKSPRAFNIVITVASCAPLILPLCVPLRSKKILFTNACHDGSSPALVSGIPGASLWSMAMFVGVRICSFSEFSLEVMVSPSCGFYKGFDGEMV